MKLTWFTQSCFRLHVGGLMIVLDPHAAPPEIDQQELVSGADEIVTLGDAGLAAFDAGTWTPRKAKSFIESGTEPPLALYRFGQKGLFVDPPGDDPVILTDGGGAWDRFADGAVIVLFGQAAALPDRLSRIVRVARPKLVAIAAGDLDEAGFAALATAAAGTNVQVLEPALALEA